MGNSLDPRLTPTQRFGRELARYRKIRKLTQASLGVHLACSPSLIGHIEKGDRTPQYEFAIGCDHILQPHQPGYFAALHKAIDDDPFAPDWFLEWLRLEPLAKTLRSWDPLLVPGLLQTEDYARAVFKGHLATPDKVVEEQVTARRHRQAILHRDDPPDVRVLIDELVFLRCFGGPGVMADQFRHLATMAALRTVTVQIVPAESTCTDGLMGAFAIAEFGDGPTTVSVDSAGDGDVSADSDLVSIILGRYDRLRTEACRPAESLARIEEAAEQWTKRT